MGDKFKFFYPLKVRFSETDAQRHVFFGNYYTYFDEALLAYMRALGYEYQNLLGDGMDLLYVESLCRHHTPAFSIYNQQSEQLVATGHIVAVNVDADSRRPAPVPEELRRAVREYES
jgi:acyl-CoA thioester hydrolase